MKTTLNLNYGAVSALYWMSFGAIIPFASAFLLGNGYTNSEIGILLAIASLIATIMQPVLADIADKQNKFTCIEVTGCVLLVIFALNIFLLFTNHRTVGLTVTFGLIYAGNTALQPLVNSICYKLEESGYHINFGLWRGIGSLSYAIVSAILGTLVERMGTIVIPESEQLFVILFLLALYFAKKNFKKAKERNTDGNGTKEQEERINLIDFVRNNKYFILLNVGVIFVYFQNSILNTYMLQIVNNVGGTAQDMGFITAMKASLELIPMALLDVFLKRFKSSTLVRFGACGFIVKVGLIFIAGSVPMLYIGNAMQIISLSFFLPAMVVFTKEIMKKGEAVKGQAFYVACTSVSGIFANLFGGMILDNLGAKAMLGLALITTATGAVIVFISIAKLDKERK